MSSPDPSSKKDNQRNSKKETKKDNQPLSLLKDLPNLSKAPAMAKKNQGFDDFDFEDDHAQKSVLGNPSSKYSKAEQHLNDFYKEEKEGFKVPQQKF
jgi:hypothetical protein